MRSISSSVILSAVRSYSFVVFGDAWPAIRFIAVNVRPAYQTPPGTNTPIRPSIVETAAVRGLRGRSPLTTGISSIASPASWME